MFVESNNKELSLCFECLFLILFFQLIQLWSMLQKYQPTTAYQLRGKKRSFLRIRVLRTAGCLLCQVWPTWTGFQLFHIELWGQVT